MHSNDFKNLHCPDLFQQLAATSVEHEKLKDPKFWATIPMLNYTPLHLLKDLQVVRFRGMIQDMQDPEIYLERYEVRNRQNDTKRTQNGKYRDCLLLKPGEEINYESECNTQGERRTMFVIAIPGINSWAFDYEAERNSINLPSMTTGEEFSCPTGNAKKRAASESMEVDEELAANDNNNSQNNQDNRDNASNKRQCKHIEGKQGETKTAASIGADYLLNSPIPERPSKAVMIKMYDDFDSYSLNSVIDVVGFLSVDPALDGTNIDEMDQDNMNEVHAQNPPPSLIPRLHAIAVKVLPHHNPLMDEHFLPIGRESTEDISSMLAVQKDLRMLLGLCFFNDDLAAEYMLSHLISTVYTRSEFQSIGKFSLNVCNLPRQLPENYAKKLYEILELLLPSSHYLPMTLETLNTAAFVPKKDYETNKLVSGLLQLAPHTHLVLDETQMEQGKLENAGVLAVQNLAHLINHQQIKCNFQFYDIDYDVDVPVFVLSEGRSMLPNDFALPLQIDAQSVELMEETLKAARHYLQPERLQRFRRYLTKAKTMSYAMNPADTEIVQEDFVEMRKAGVITTPDDLHALLVLSRLLGISRGKTVFDKESWELAKDMEKQRRTRIQSLPKSNRANTN